MGLHFFVPRGKNLGGNWPKEIFWSNASLWRLSRAVHEVLPLVIKVLPANYGAYIQSGRTSEVYHTTLCQCSCQDFSKRMMPCKHIFALAIAAEGYDGLLESAYEIPKRVTEMCFKISSPIDFVKIAARSLCGSSSQCIFTERTSSVKNLVSCGAIIEDFNDRELLEKFDTANLTALIKISRKKPFPKKKSEQIGWIIENIPEIVSFCRLQYAYVQIHPDFQTAAKFHIAYYEANNCHPFYLPK